MKGRGSITTDAYTKQKNASQNSKYTVMNKILKIIYAWKTKNTEWNAK